MSNHIDSAHVRSAAFLTVLIDDEAPNIVETWLPLPPDRSWRRGERRSELVRGVHPYSGVEFRSQLDDSENIHAHLQNLLARIAPAGGAIRNLVGLESVHSVRLTLAEHTFSDNVDVILTSEDVGAISALGAELVFDVYVLPDP